MSESATVPAAVPSRARAVTVHDLHATMLHLVGIDHKRLTYMHNGQPFLSDEASSKLRMPYRQPGFLLKEFF